MKSLQTKSGLTKRAPDVWDSAAFSSIFLASSFSCSQALSSPAHTQVTQTVGLPNARSVMKISKDESTTYFLIPVIRPRLRSAPATTC